MGEMISDYTPPSDAGQDSSLLDGPGVLQKNQDYIRSTYRRGLDLVEESSGNGVIGDDSLSGNGPTEDGVYTLASERATDTYDYSGSGILFDGEAPEVQMTGEVTLSNREKKRLARAAAKDMIQPDTEPVYGKGKYGQKNAAAARLREVVDEKIAKYQEGYRNGRKSLRKGKK